MTKITESGFKIKFMKVDRFTKDTRIGLTNYIKKDFFMLIPVCFFYTVTLKENTFEAISGTHDGIIFMNAFGRNLPWACMVQFSLDR